MLTTAARADDPKVLATVNGVPITEQDVEDALQDIGPGLPEKLEGAAREKYVVDYLIDLQLVAKKADADKMDATRRLRAPPRLLPRQIGHGSRDGRHRQRRDDGRKRAQGL